jgi:tetratricopeptide (TPR) repeat protein
MICFELYRQLDIRVFQTISAIDPGYGSCAKYVFERDSLILLGMDHSVRLDVLTKEVKKDSPIRNWDIESEAVMWFAEDSAEAALIRLINDAYRKWYRLDANISDDYFNMELEEVNSVLAGYALRIFADESGLSVFHDEPGDGSEFTFEQAVDLIMEVDENRMDDAAIAQLINEALYYRKLDRFEEATVRLEKVIRYMDHTLPEYTHTVFTLAETYYFMGNYERAVMLYYRVNLGFIEDERDFFLHLGHALVDEKMKKYDRHLRIYFHSRIDSEFADTHRQAVAAAKASVAQVFEEYEETCLEMGRKKYESFRQSLPAGADDIDELIEEYEKPEERAREIHKQYEGFGLKEPKSKAETGNMSMSERLSTALDHYLTGEYQKAFDMYYRLASQTDEDSDYYTWIYLQLGKLYCFFDEPAKAWHALERCNPNRFGIVYRLEDFMILYQHAHIVAEDFESDERFRKLVRGKMDTYYAQYDREYNKLLKDRKLMRSFKVYEKDCIEDTKYELRDVLNDGRGKSGGLFARFRRSGDRSD